MEREILFGDRLHLPSGGGGSSCELELLRLLRDVDLAVLERHQRWKSRLADADDALARRDAELKQTKLDLAASRAEASQLRDRVAYLESLEGDLVAKYDRRIGELKEDVSRIKKRYGDLKASASSSDAADFWRNRAVELEKEVASLRERERTSREDRAEKGPTKVRELERVVSEKDGVIDRLTDKVTQLTKRLRQVESSAGAPVAPPAAAGVGTNSWDPPDLVEQYLKTCQDDRALKNASELRSKIERHMQEFTARMEQDKRTL
ncbi:centrosomal protein of 63 kDa [Dermacentor silvarum]|uniref:centrosomal protein of 63 kDa n=1 Tax=Dermacentor silvarum TaxID=543639 RepID=UPI001898B872|nr:centrosomal protein of 63 kDa [Dermacentor silvarum]